MNPSESLCACVEVCNCEKCKRWRKDQRNEKGEANLIQFVEYGVQMLTILIILIYATASFWIVVSHHVYHSGVRLYQSDRDTQLLAAAMFAILIISIIINVGPRAIFSAKSQTQPKAGKGLFFSMKISSVDNCPKKPAKSCLSFLKNIPTTTKTSTDASTKTINKNVTITISDEKAKEIFKQSKIYAIPTELKQPPALLVYLRDVILRNSS